MMRLPLCACNLCVRLWLWPCAIEVGDCCILQRLVAMLCTPCSYINMGTWHGDPGTDSVDATGVVLMMLCYLFVCVLSRVQSTGWVYVGCGMRMPSSGVSASCLRMCGLK